MAYEFYYWPSIQGRGEFVRLALEEAGAEYIDVARRPESEGGGVATLMAFLEREDIANPPFAPPFLKDGDVVIGQTAAILLYLGDRHGLAPREEAKRLWVHQIQLTIADLVGEAHDTHHPLGGDLYYEDQKPEALRRAKYFSPGGNQSCAQSSQRPPPTGPARLVEDVRHKSVTPLRARAGPLRDPADISDPNRGTPDGSSSSNGMIFV
jgi:hypothetical protein